jgi:hypothetical protein
MLNPRMTTRIDWESTIPDRLSPETKSLWEARSADFRKRREDLVSLVCQGEMTLKAARQRSAELAEEMTRTVDDLTFREKSRTPKLTKTLAEAERVRLKPLSPEQAQRRTMDLLMHNLTELRIANRREEFEARTFVKAAANALPAPSVEKLFAYLEESVDADDAAAAEWCRRQLERLRAYVADETTKDRIDVACDRPGMLNRRLVAKYRDAIMPRLSEPGLVEALLDKGIASADANACAAVFEIARREPEALRPETLEKVASAVERMPDQAFSYAKFVDREARRESQQHIEGFAEIGRAWVEQAAALAEVRQPTEPELQRMERIASLPPLAADEPIGLVRDGRGLAASLSECTEDRNQDATRQIVA